ncbi:50S ribosomal protein L35ae [Candidatus Woesearchaeota archaeon]|nr:50S ribosomal protein L35ae [Candidatus Woesearchaeota archaeon]
MKGIIVNFRGGRHTQKNNHMIIKVNSIDNKTKANQFLNKNVVWKSPKGKEIKGQIVKEHGNKGALRAIFEKGMPGQSVGTEVEVENGA